MHSKGNDALITNTKVTEWNFNHGGYIPLAFGGLILLGCVTAYVVAVARGNVDPILPLISDAAGSPPQNGLFGTLICLGGMCGVVFMLQRYMIVLEKNRETSGLVTAINKFSLFVGILSMLGITLVTGYPVNFYRNRDIWLLDVGLPHMIGGVMLFSLGLLYIALQCMLTLFQRSARENSLSLRVILLLVCTASFVHHMITVPDNFGGISHLYYQNNTDYKINYTDLLPLPPTMGASLKLPIDTGGTYVASAVTEWTFVFFFCCFFFTFYKEAQEYSLQVVVETHTTHEPEVADEAKLDWRKMSQNGSQVDSKPSPDVRKVLRRDSTCQTISEGQDKVITPSKYMESNKKSGKKSTAHIDISNGTQKLSNADIDAKLNKLLSATDTKDLNSVETLMKDSSTNCESLPNEEADKEAERIAIEKLEDAVKDAERRVEDNVKITTKDVKEASKQSNGKETVASACSLSVQ